MHDGQQAFFSGSIQLLDAPRGLTVWVARSAEVTASALLRAIRAHSRVDVKPLGDEAHGALANEDDVFIVDPAYLQSLAALPPSSNGPGPASSRGGLAPATLRRVKDAIEDQMAQGISLAQLARIARLSECHFSRAFKQSMGIPPHRYLTQRRLEVAAHLTRHTDRPLADIALAAGFSDQSHFSRCFLRRMGQTPGAFRRRHR